MTPFEVYLVMQADKVIDTVGPISVLSGMALVGLIIAIIIMSSRDEEDFRSWTTGIINDTEYRSFLRVLGNIKTASKVVGLLFFSSLLAVTLLPSTKTLIAMYAIPAVVNNEKVQKLPDQTLDAIGAWLEKAKEAAKK